MKELKSSILPYAFDVKLMVIFSNKITLIASTLLEFVLKNTDMTSQTFERYYIANATKFLIIKISKLVQKELAPIEKINTSRTISD